MLSRIRSAITGRFVDTNEAAASPATTVREQFETVAADVLELRTAAEAVILGAGFQQEAGRTEVNQRDLERLKAALGGEPGQP